MLQSSHTLQINLQDYIGATQNLLYIYTHTHTQ